MRINQRILCLKPVHNKVKSMSTGVNEMESSTILNWLIKLCWRIKSFSYKNVLPPRENKPCHFLEKLLIPKASYQLQKYNKA